MHFTHRRKQISISSTYQVVNIVSYRKINYNVYAINNTTGWANKNRTLCFSLFNKN